MQYLIFHSSETTSISTFFRHRALDKNEYNHITATYFLLAERKLRAYRQEQVQKRRPEQLSLAVPSDSMRLSPNKVGCGAHELSSIETNSNNFLLPPNAGHLGVLSTPGADGTVSDATFGYRFNEIQLIFVLPSVFKQSGRVRKCSIVQEEDDDEDEANRNDMSNPLNRRGSRSEGRINITVQDRLAETERLKKECTAKMIATAVAPTRSMFDGICGVTILTSGDSDPKNRLGRIRSSMHRPIDFRPKPTDSVLKPAKQPQQHPTTSLAAADVSDEINVNQYDEDTGCVSLMDNNLDVLNRCRESNSISTKFHIDASTISIPISLNQPATVAGPPKYKTMPSPTRANTILPGGNCLNEIFEEGTDVGSSDTSVTTTPRPVTRHTTFTNSPAGHGTNVSSSAAGGSAHRRSKFHKTRTASCSSSDDDDSENRKKRAHKIVDSTKPFQQQRRDSHDDSSDSQDPSNATGGCGTNSNSSQCVDRFANTQSTEQSQVNNTNGGNTNGRQKSGQVAGFRRNRAGRRRAGETRLRESQSLNRITEVQESELPLSSLLQMHSAPNAAAALQTQPSSSSSSSLLTEPGTFIAAASGGTENGSNGSSMPSLAAEPSASSSNVKSNKMGFSARLFHGFRKNETTSSSSVPRNYSNCHWDGNGHPAGTDEVDASISAELAKALKVTSENKSSTAAKKLKMLGRYFQVRQISLFYRSRSRSQSPHHHSALCLSSR